MKFGIGQPVPRNEDPTLLTGAGSYTDDRNAEGQAYGVFVRSAHAHGVLGDIEVEEARGMPGVLAIVTAADLDAAGFGNITCGVPLKNRDGSDMANPTRPSLATDRVRFVGDPIALVVAETPVQARDAAEAVIADVEPLGAVTDAAAAVAPDAPRLYDTLPNNVILDYHYGDAAAVLRHFGLSRIRLLTNNPRKVDGLEEFGVEVAERVRIEPGPGPVNHGYLRTKKRKLGHWFEAI